MFKVKGFSETDSPFSWTRTLIISLYKNILLNLIFSPDIDVNRYLLTNKKKPFININDING